MRLWVLIWPRNTELTFFMCTRVLIKSNVMNNNVAHVLDRRGGVGMKPCQESGVEVKGPPLKWHRITLAPNQGWQISRAISAADTAASVIIFKSLSFNFKCLLLICSSEFKRYSSEKQRAHAGGGSVSPQPSQTLHALFVLLLPNTWPEGTPPLCIRVVSHETSETRNHKSHPEHFSCHGALCVKQKRWKGNHF